MRNRERRSKEKGELKDVEKEEVVEEEGKFEKEEKGVAATICGDKKRTAVN